MEITILWADDEIDMLKPHVMFLEEKGYRVLTANNGDDALDMFREDQVDIVFLDENMPGMSGLEVLTQLKSGNPQIPVIMITKSEEEEIMEDAIGSKISDYLIKPVNPKQILLSVKKNLDTKRLVSEKTASNYQMEFRNIGMQLGDRLTAEDWKDVYKKMVFWGMELEASKDEAMLEVFQMQKSEANAQFSKFIEKNYIDWLHGEDDPPLLSHNVFEHSIAPLIGNEEPLFVILIDNLRLDQWRAIRPILENYFRVDDEDLYYSILPTVTHYARNAFFAGLLPLHIEKMFPKLWKGEDDEGGKNLHEEEFLENQLKRLGKNVRFSYNKVTNLRFGRKLADNFNNLLNNQLNVIVYNFVDMLSHARTEMEVIRELASDESAYRSLTVSWFEHSPLLDILQQVAENGCRVVITTDHGSVQVNTPSKVLGDRHVNTNLRYKQGRNMQYAKKEVFEVKNPEDVFLPRNNVSTTYIFAPNDVFFAYPNNYNYYVNYYRDTFQHGGISLEEVVIPFVVLNPK